MIYVVATLTIAEGKEAELLEAARPAIAATRQEQGCIAYDLHRSVTEPSTFVFVERWATRENLSAHMQAPHFKVWRAAAGPLIQSRRIEVISSSEVEVL